MKVLRFLDQSEIEKFVDPTAYNIVEYFLKKVIFSQPEVKKESELGGIQMTKEFLEDWIAQACGMEKVGAGNYPIDVYKENTFGADVKFLTAKINKDGELRESASNETSLSQNFKTAGENLDQMFAEENFDEILSLWADLVYEKIQTPKNDHSLAKIYYFIFIRGFNKIYLSIAEVNEDLIKDIKVSSANKTSVYTQDFIDPEYGTVKVYKSKKRMELRLFPKKMVEDKKTIVWNFENLYPDVVSLRDVAKQGDLPKHLKKQIKKYFG